jgi:hypothetical protein
MEEAFRRMLDYLDIRVAQPAVQRADPLTRVSAAPHLLAADGEKMLSSVSCTKAVSVARHL